MSTQEIIIAGFGGQGVMLAGKILVYLGMKKGKKVSFIPSYGPEMRGGTANCSVIISDEEVGSPVVTEPNVVVALNKPSLEKFEKMLKPGGTLVYNSSLIDVDVKRDDIKIVKIGATDLAKDDVGDPRVTNMVILGTYAKTFDVFGLDELKAVLKEVLPARHHKLLPMNEKAMDLGYEKTEFIN